MTEFITLIILAFASYRITRFLVIDTLPQTVRVKFHTFLLNRKHLRWLAEKVYELTSCTWCLGMHVSWALWWVYSKTYPWDFGVKGWLTAFGIAGIQGMLHAIEPGEDDDHVH